MFFHGRGLYIEMECAWTLKPKPQSLLLEFLRMEKIWQICDACTNEIHGSDTAPIQVQLKNSCHMNVDGPGYCPCSGLLLYGGSAHFVDS